MNNVRLEMRIMQVARAEQAMRTARAMMNAGMLVFGVMLGYSLGEWIINGGM